MTTPATRGRRAIRALFASAALLTAGLFTAPALAATTYYVRADGGDASQCTGRSDAPYPGSGTAQACAWKHPFVALPPGRSARIAGGDTLIVGTGQYMMGIGAPDSAGCSASASYDCHLAPVPSGPSATAPTRILGKGFDAGCSAPPQLWGTERAYTVFNLRGSSNVEIGCFEVTDHATCIRGHGGGLACPSSGSWARAGVIAQDSSNVKLTDLNIHGLADKGIHAGRLRDWTLTRVTLRANGWIGWDGDIGAGVSSNSGSIAFRESEIAWNGCTETYPSTGITGCWGQQTGGYGDGLGTHQTGGDWLFEDTLVHHNTSDGIDLLYMADGGSVTIRRVWAEGNAGNQLKTKGNARIENSVVVGNCAYFQGKYNMLAGDNCRAQGNALSIGLFAGSVVEILNNTISSQGDCLVLSGGGGTAAKLNFTNNAMIGEIDWTNTAERSCLHYADASSAVVGWDRNYVTGVKNASCPAGNVCGADPKIVNRDYAGFDATPVSGSPLIDAANGSRAPTTDYHNRTRSTADIGAIEFGATAVAPTPTPAPAPAPEPTPSEIVVKIGGISALASKNGQFQQYRASVRVIDASGKLIPNATVSGRWTNAGVTAASGVTDATGTASIDGGRVRRGGKATFCATAITGSGLVFDGVQACATSN